MSDRPIDNRHSDPRPATLADVGALAGVSSATASRVLNGTGHRVAEPLRKRVLAAAEQLDYVPNARAQALMRPETHTVGVIAFDVNNPYFTEIIAGVLGVAARTGRMVTIGNVYREPATELVYLGLLRSQRVGAIILTGSGRTDPEHNARLHTQLERFRASGGRVALIGRHSVVGDIVRPDNVGGGAAAARALLELGHTRIGVIAGRRDMTVTVDRLSGFLEACEAAGCALAPEQVQTGDFTRDGGSAAMARLLDREPGMTAVFCLSDTMALGALRVLRERGIDVPGRMSVIGFDDVAIARELTPALSSVRVPLGEMGEAAMGLLIEPATPTARTRWFQTELCMRGTTGPAPA